MKRIYSCLVILGMVLLGGMIGGMVSATSLLNDDQLIEYSVSDVIFPSPCGNDDDGGAGLLEGKDNKERVWNWFVNAGIEGVSDNPVVIAGIMGNLGVESGYNPFADNGQGYYGLYQTNSADMREYVEGKIGPVEWGTSTDDAEKNSAAIAAELEWLQNNSRFKQFVKDLDAPNDKTGSAGARAYAELFLVQYERAIYGDGAIEDPGVYDYMQKMYDGTIYKYQNAKGRRDGAEKMFAYVQENSTEETTSSGSGEKDPSCNSNNKGSKNINGAAAALAWPLNESKKSYTKRYGGTAAPLFVEAFGSKKSWSGYFKAPYCSGFTAAVVRWSGYDKSFPTTNWGGVGNAQISHIKNKDLWEIFWWDKKKSSLKGGDVLNCVDTSRGHSVIIVEDENGELYVAEGSLGEGTFGHIEEYRNVCGSGRTLIARAKYANNSPNGVNVKDKDGVKTSSITGTISDTGKGNGNIGASAVELAWPYSDFTGAKKYSKKATDKFTKFYETLSGRDGDSKGEGGKSCDYFVHTVLVYSGLETNDKLPWGHVGTLRDYFIKSDDWEEVEMKDNRKLDEYKDGDIVIYFCNDSQANSKCDFNDGQGPGANHIAILVEVDGKKYTAQASHGTYYGVVKGTGNITGNLGPGDANFDYVRVFRNKKNKTGGAKCDICDDGSDGGQLKAGGFTTVEEATAFMQSYIDAASPGGKYYNKSGDVLFGVKNGFVNDGGCPYGVLNNCVAFSQWFINNYTTLGPNWKKTGNGIKVVDNLVSAGLERGTGENPQPYAIFSNKGVSPDGHTGVILGVNTATRKVIVGEANCNENKRWPFTPPTAKEYSFDDIKDWWYAYTDKVRSMGGPLKDA